MSIEFIPDILIYSTDYPQMLLSKPFLINKFSSSTLITKFIFERLEIMVDYYYLDDEIIQNTKNKGGPVVLLTYGKIYI